MHLLHKYVAYGEEPPQHSLVPYRHNDGVVDGEGENCEKANNRCWCYLNPMREYTPAVVNVQKTSDANEASAHVPFKTKGEYTDQHTTREDDQKLRELFSLLSFPMY